jgi:hypothetical protein
MAEQVIPVRGANGMNLLVNPSEPADYADLRSCQNIDMSLERAVMPRRGLARVTVWNGVTFDSNGDLRTGETVMPAFGRQVLTLISNVGNITDPPTALGV